MEKTKKDLQREGPGEHHIEETQEGALQGEAEQPCQKCQVGVVKAQAEKVQILITHHWKGGGDHGSAQLHSSSGS